jgi:DNA-binding transcriptional MerR regulator
LDKAPDAFRTISEVADDLDIPQHVLRFWETRFAQIKPMKRSGGRRYYRPDDVDLLRGIRRLLYGEGYTIRGVQRILKEHGVKSVQGMAAGGSLAPSAASVAAVGDSAGRDYSGHDEDEPDAGATNDEEDVAEAPAVVRRVPEMASPVMPRVDPPVLPQAPFAMAAKADEGGGARNLDIARLKTALEELIACRQLLDHALREG